MASASQALAIFRGMQADGWIYGNSTIKGSSHNWAGRECDCQGAVDWVMMKLGEQNHLGPLLPWSVVYTVAHTTWPKSFGSRFPQARPGDLIVLGDGHTYKHIGMIVEDTSRYISMYDYGVNIIERAINNTASMHPMVLISTGFAQMNTLPLGDTIGTFAVSADAAVRGIKEDGTLVGGLSGQKVPVYTHEMLVTDYNGLPDSREVYTTVLNGFKVYLLRRNGTFTPNPTDSAIAAKFEAIRQIVES